MRRHLLLALPLLLLAGCSGDTTKAGGSGGGLSAADKGKEVLLRIKRPVGDKQTLTFSMDMTVTPPQGQGNPMNMKMSMASMDEVIKVENGKITSKTTITEATGSGDGPFAAIAKQMKDIKGKTFTGVTSDRGETLDAGELSAQMMQGSRPVFPEKPVKAGDTWSETIDSQGQKMDATFKAEGVEMVDGEEAMKIRMTIKNTQFNMEIPFDMWIATSTGRLIKGEAHASMDQQGASLKMDLTMASK